MRERLLPIYGSLLPMVGGGRCALKQVSATGTAAYTKPFTTGMLQSLVMITAIGSPHLTNNMVRHIVTNSNFDTDQKIGNLAAKSYNATKNRDAAVQLMLNNSALTRNEAILLWEAIDAYVDLFQK